MLSKLPFDAISSPVPSQCAAEFFCDYFVPDEALRKIPMVASLLYTGLLCLRWLEIFSWRARPGPLIARARASTPGSRKCKSSNLVHLKIFAQFIFQSKISLIVDGENL